MIANSVFKNLTTEDIEDILSRRATTITHAEEKGSTFSKASFSTSDRYVLFPKDHLLRKIYSVEIVFTSRDTTLHRDQTLLVSPDFDFNTVKSLH